MTDTVQLNLPLLSPSQAQKHVTVNEALTRLDGLVQLRLISISQTTPPGVFQDGDAYGVPAGGVNEWAGQDGQIALAVNGGWEFVTPRRGFRAVVLDSGGTAMHDGAAWRPGAATLSPNGTAMRLISDEVDVPVTADTVVTTPPLFPARSIVFGVTGLVISAIGGAPTWRLGVAGDDLRYGSGLGVAQNSWVSGPSTPMVYWAPTELVMTSEGADFTGGTVRLAAHYMMLDLPDWV